MTRNKQACCFQLLWQHINVTHIMIIINNTIFNESLTLRIAPKTDVMPCHRAGVVETAEHLIGQW